MSTNISGEKRQALLSKIAEIKSFIEQNSNDKNASQLISYLGDLTREVNGKKYGLVFEEHREAIDEKLEQNAPVFTEEKDLFIDNGGELNFLLEGDNLASLKLLEKTHRGKIDVIYIDPPYNTGNKDFIYDDNYVDSVDQFRHSKWLSFMEKRLKIAKNLLKDTGAIFISIDDNEVANLKILCDEIFGENLLLGITSVAKGTTTGQDANKFGSSVDYIIAYGMPKFQLQKDDLSEEDKLRFNKEDENGRYSILQFRKTGNGDKREDRPNLFFPLISPDGSEVFPIGPTGYESRWRGDMKFWNNMLEKNMVEWIHQKDGWKPYIKFYLEGRGKAVSNLWDNIDGNKKATIELKEALGEKLFTNPKPTDLIRKILKITQSSTILDFFAGSGTTGHAVLKLNAEDGGHRKFILCTNNENNICREITYQRLKTVITGSRMDGSKYSDGLPGSLKYFKTDFIPISEKMYYEYADDLLLHVRELVELENAVNFDKDKTVAIVLDDDEMEEFIATLVESGRNEQKDTSTGLSVRSTVLSVRALYVGHDVLVSGKQERILKSHNISINTIPDYYYRDLAL